MTESVIVTAPILWIPYGIALLLCVVDLIKRLGHAVQIITAAIVVGTTVYAVLIGMSLYEATTVMLVFLGVNLISYARHKGDKEQ